MKKTVKERSNVISIIIYSLKFQDLIVYRCNLQEILFSIIGFVVFKRREKCNLAVIYKSVDLIFYKLIGFLFYRRFTAEKFLGFQR